MLQISCCLMDLAMGGHCRNPTVCVSKVFGSQRNTVEPKPQMVMVVNRKGSYDETAKHSLTTYASSGSSLGRLSLQVMRDTSYVVSANGDVFL